MTQGAKPIEILKQYYGYPSFRAGQEAVINAVLSGRDCLAVMPTGAGKSLCFQIPAFIFEGATLVVSPLISLMRDQVAALTQNGLAAAFINSSLSQGQTEKALQRARSGAYKVIYVAPERLDTPSFASFAQNADISMVAVDEAHCVSQWGQDFRPSYLNIADFVSSLKKRPVLAAFTATATGVVRNDIIKMLNLDSPFTLTTGFNRENLYFEVRRPRDKYAELTAFLKENAGKSGIVYCATRKTADEVTQKLNGDGYSAAGYHAGLSQADRAAAQDDFLYDRKQVIVATNAFGMGIDKSNVGFVAHFNMPKNMESYYQEAGRAGRDGSPAECLLLFSARDIIINKFLIEQTSAESPLSSDEQNAVKARDYKRLRQMEEYCKTTGCLRRFILDYFDDKEDISCDNCGNCLATYRQRDITTEAQKILSCVYRVKERFGITLVVDVLRGAKSEKLINAGLDKIKTYGAMSGNTAREIREIADVLLRQGYLVSVGDEYPVVKLGEGARSVLFEGRQVFMDIFADEDLSKESADKTYASGRRRDKRTAKPSIRAGINQDLFIKLKALRLKLAQEEDVPAYVIFSDATLVDMCAKTPADEDAFLNVSGVGQMKRKKYGKVFLGAINDFRALFGAAPVSDAVNEAESISAFVRAGFEFFEEPVSVSVFMGRVNALVLQRRDRGLALRRVTRRLVDEGYLEDTETDGKKSRAATQKGLDAGISTVREVIEASGGADFYYRNYYNIDAQRLLLSFVTEILDSE
ncbi:MAG: DNA helicase RecQ [Clostridiales bacterium]|jgi:ATP-dependent DNA helicase RecQ|nr:DNA helicase RecQ [Clostridiales bacterium]